MRLRKHFRGNQDLLSGIGWAQEVVVHFVRSMVCTGRNAVHPEAVPGRISQTPDPGGGAALSDADRTGGHDGTECTHRTEPATGGAHYEEVLMRAETFCGGHSVRFCPLTITDMRKSAIQPC